jgi:capsid protein
MDPIWTWWVDTAIAAGLLPEDERLYGVTWSSPQFESADRYNDAKAYQMEMRLGLRSRREIILATGRDPDDVDRDIALDNERRDALGIVSDGDPRQTSLAGLEQPSDAESAEE